MIHRTAIRLVRVAAGLLALVSFAVPWTHATLLVPNYLLFTSAESGAGETGYFPGSQP